MDDNKAEDKSGKRRRGGGHIAVRAPQLPAEVGRFINFQGHNFATHRKNVRYGTSYNVGGISIASAPMPGSYIYEILNAIDRWRCDHWWAEFHQFVKDIKAMGVKKYTEMITEAAWVATDGMSPKYPKPHHACMKDHEYSLVLWDLQMRLERKKEEEKKKKKEKENALRTRLPPSGIHAGTVAKNSEPYPPDTTV